MIRISLRDEDLTCVFCGEPSMWAVEEKGLCADHFLEIAGQADVFFKAPSTQRMVARAYSEYADVKSTREAGNAMRDRLGVNAPGFVYYIAMDDLIKIGYAEDVTKRMRSYPPSARLLAVHPGTKTVEKAMHDDFRSFLSRGREWFTPSSPVMAHIEKVREVFGDPSKFAYKYRDAKKDNTRYATGRPAEVL